MILLFRLCRQFDHEPMLLGYLISVSCRGFAINGTNAVLQSEHVSKESRESLEHELATWNALADVCAGVENGAGDGIGHVPRVDAVAQEFGSLAG